MTYCVWALLLVISQQVKKTDVQNKITIVIILGAERYSLWRVCAREERRGCEKTERNRVERKKGGVRASMYLVLSCKNAVRKEGSEPEGELGIEEKRGFPPCQPSLCS